MPARATSDAWSETASPRTLAVRDKSRPSDAASKRKRAGTDHHEAARANHRRRTVSPDGRDSDSDAFDPDQPLEERRRVQQGFRDLMRNVTDNADEFLKGESRGLDETLRQANQLSRDVRQTAEATIDSRLLVTTADLTYRKVTRMTQGNAAQGVDLDEFVSKCISYMKHGSGIRDDDGPGLSSTQRMRRSTGGRGRHGGHNGDEEDDEIGDEGDMLNWPHLGQYACLPAIRRPALMGFLVGPMSVEKKARKITKRSAPFRAANLPETRPEVIDVQAVGGRKEADLTAMCAGILQRLGEVQVELQQTVQDLLDEDDDMDEDEQVRIMLSHGLRSTGGVDFMRFVVDPKSFGQTVENLFYVSFLIRDGKVKIELDEHELPSIAPVRAEDQQGRDGRRHGHGSAKHQAIWKMDMKMWREIIEAFDIKEGLIEHRHYEINRGPGAKAWYG